MTHHNLKCWPQYFNAIKEGRKTFEIRYDDRCFRVGDTITLMEYDPSGGISISELNKYTGNTYEACIGYVTGFEQKPGFVVFSLLPRENQCFIGKEQNEHT